MLSVSTNAQAYLIIAGLVFVFFGLVGWVVWPHIVSQALPGAVRFGLVGLGMVLVVALLSALVLIGQQHDAACDGDHRLGHREDRHPTIRAGCSEHNCSGDSIRCSIRRDAVVTRRNWTVLPTARPASDRWRRALVRTGPLRARQR